MLAAAAAEANAEDSSAAAQVAQLAAMSAALTVSNSMNPPTGERVGQLKGGFVKGQWTKEEDELVCKYVELYGTKQWARIALVLPGRKGKQCRERWHNHLNPDISKEAWTHDEDLKLVEAHLVCSVCACVRALFSLLFTLDAVPHPSARWGAQHVRLAWRVLQNDALAERLQALAIACTSHSSPAGRQARIQGAPN